MFAWSRDATGALPDATSSACRASPCVVRPPARAHFVGLALDDGIALVAVVGSVGGRLAVVVEAGISLGAVTSAVVEGIGSGCFGGSLLSQAASMAVAISRLPRNVIIIFTAGFFLR